MAWGGNEGWFLEAILVGHGFFGTFLVQCLSLASPKDHALDDFDDRRSLGSGRLLSLLASHRRGAGTGINGAIYSELGRNPSFKADGQPKSRESSEKLKFARLVEGSKLFLMGFPSKD